MECLGKIVLDFLSLTIFTKISILDVWQGTEYAFIELSILDTKVLKCI